MRAENQGDRSAMVQAETSRFELWRAGRKIIEANPLFGVGSRRFGEFSRQYEEIDYDNRSKNSHHTYIEIVATAGLIGLICFVFMEYSLVWELRRRSPNEGPPWLDATRLATLISFCSLPFRALLDAKPNEWAFCILCVIGVSCAALRRRIDLSSKRMAETPASRGRDEHTSRAALGAVHVDQSKNAGSHSGAQGAT